MRDEMWRQNHGKFETSWIVERCESCDAWHVREVGRGWYLTNRVRE